MATVVPIYSYIYGFLGGTSRNPYKLNDVLNFIGVLSKRDNIPIAITPYASPLQTKPYSYRGFGKEYYVPKNWRDCLYVDLVTWHYYIISPSRNNSIGEASWDAFRITDLFHGIRVEHKNNSGNLISETLNHSGSFIDLSRKVGINEVLDTLSKNEKPIRLNIRENIYDSDGRLIYTFFKFDID